MPFGGALIENLLRMGQRIHKRLPVGFVQEVLEAFNTHRISEKEAMELLGLRRSRLHQLRKRWLLSSQNRPFCLWQRRENAFHVLSEEVKQWLDRELYYICREADLFRGKFNFAFLAEQAERSFHRPFSRNSLRLYALRNGYYHALPQQKAKVYTRFESSGPGALFQHDSSYHLWIPTRGSKQYLILTKDDYSRKVVGARIVEKETTFEHLQTARQTLTTLWHSVGLLSG